MENVSLDIQFIITNRCFKPGLILGFHPANEIQYYFVMVSLIGWVQAYNQPCLNYMA